MTCKSLDSWGRWNACRMQRRSFAGGSGEGGRGDLGRVIDRTNPIGALFSMAAWLRGVFSVGGLMACVEKGVSSGERCSQFDASTMGRGNWPASGVKRLRNHGLGNVMLESIRGGWLTEIGWTRFPRCGPGPVSANVFRPEFRFVPRIPAVNFES